jgi:hypothetical protein
MSVPSKSKTWQFNVNSVCYHTTPVYRLNLMALQIKNALKGFGTNPWTVSGSSDGSTSGMDGTDRWTDYTKILHNNDGSSHSWIVLRQTGLNTKFEVCIDCNSASSSYTATFLISPANGFGTTNGGTDGSTTARPTATDSYTLPGTSWGGSDSSPTYVVHCMQSTDGKCTRVVVCSNGAPINILVFDTANNTITGWNTPKLLFGVYSHATNATTYGTLNANANLVVKANSFYIPVWLATLGYASATFGLNPGGSKTHSFTGEWPFMPISIAGNGTNGCGIFGTPYDLYWGSAALQNADYPGYGWTQFGNLILPWDGSTLKKQS